MQDTTTIEVRDDQADDLKALKEHDRESYKSVLDRLLSDSDDADEPAPVVNDTEIAREVSRQIDYTALADAVADEVVGRLQR